MSNSIESDYCNLVTEQDLRRQNVADAVSCSIGSAVFLIATAVTAYEAVRQRDLSLGAISTIEASVSAAAFQIAKDAVFELRQRKHKQNI